MATLRAPFVHWLRSSCTPCAPCMCLQGVPKKVADFLEQCLETSFLDRFGPSRLSWTVWTNIGDIGPFWPKSMISQHCPQILLALCTFCTSLCTGCATPCVPLMIATTDKGWGWQAPSRNFSICFFVHSFCHRIWHIWSLKIGNGKCYKGWQSCVLCNIWKISCVEFFILYSDTHTI